MDLQRRLYYLLLAIIGIFILPYIGGCVWVYFNTPDNQFPASYFEYPPLTAEPKAPYNQIVFIIIAIMFAAVALLYLFPRLFGFKKGNITDLIMPPMPKVSYPKWFWIGLIMQAGTLFILWGKFSEPKWLINWADLPLFWGFTLVIDGLVYKRNGGSSLIRNAPQEIVAIGASSVVGWLLFEYLNFYVDDNWLYPKGNLIPDNEFTIYAVIGSSGLLPLAFECYSLLRTIKWLKNRFDNGIKIIIAPWIQTVILIVCFISLFLSAIFHNTLFFALWMSPMIILVIMLDKFDIWTPFTPVKQGNWTPMLLFALSYFIIGFCLEGMNYFGATHNPDQTISTHNPAYWQYSLPYVNCCHVFEMPGLGLLGYMPFGVYCCVWWIVFAYLLNIKTNYLRFENDEN